MNDGYLQSEIDQLKKEMQEEGLNFVYVEDEENLDDTGEYAHFQFVGTKDGKEVIFDALMYTLRFHFDALLFAEAEERVAKAYPNYVMVEDRTADYVEDEETELFLEEVIEQLEDAETFKVSEFVEMDLDFEYGIGLEVALNVEEIKIVTIQKFINQFNAGTLALDNTLFSFKDESEEED
jgi:hypothetical protein